MVIREIWFEGLLGIRSLRRLLKISEMHIDLALKALGEIYSKVEF